MRMKFLAIFCLLFLALTVCDGQENECSTPTIGEIFLIVKDIKVGRLENEKLDFRKSKAFDFKEFKAVNVTQVDITDFFEIGYTKDGKIREIIHHQKTGQMVSNKMIVYEFEKFRILLYQISVDGKPYSFSPSIFIIMKGQVGGRSGNFMINCRPLFGGENNVYNPNFSNDEFYHPKRLEDLSVIMALDDNLYPTSFVKLNKGKIVFSSDIVYSPVTHIVDHEVASIFFSPESNPDLAVPAETCLEKICSRSLLGDMTVTLYPMVGEVTKSLPLWIFNGAHDYK